MLRKKIMFRKFISKSLIYTFILYLLLLPLSGQAYNRQSAEDYLNSHSENGWSTMGLIALGKNNLNLDYLKNISGNNAIDFTKPILAITASGNDPRNFSNIDLVAKLKTFFIENQIGDTETVNDDIFGILSLIASGELTSDPVVDGAKQFILQKQNSDGGWGYALSANSDSNTTASAILALLASGVSPTDVKILSAINFLKSCQNLDGGFTYDPKSEWGIDSDTSSTAWVMWAINALKQDISSWTKNNKNPREYLESFQHTNGYFIFPGLTENSLSPDNTAWAIIALESKTLPLKIITPVKKQFSFRIEGANDTICEGKTIGITAMDIIKTAATICNFSYTIKDNNYLTRINTDEATGNTGWQYWINFTKSNQSASDYLLQPGDEILWAYGDIALKPLKLTATPLEIASGQSSNLFFESITDTNQPEENVKILPYATDVKTNTQGKVSVTLPDGYYKLYGEKPGFVRSVKTLLKFGNPGSAGVDLSVNIQTGSVAGISTDPTNELIAFSLEPGNLNFGSLKGGQTAKKSLTIKNQGNKPLIFEAEVKTGPIFKDNLLLEGKFWKQFKKTVTGSQTAVIESSLTIPQGTNAGNQTGQLIFWATAN